MFRPKSGGSELGRRGSVYILTAISMVPIIGVLALVLDGGLLLTERRHAQGVADTSALAAAISLYNNYTKDLGLDPSHTASAAALSIAADNGYSNDGSTSTVTVNIPPLSGLFKGDSGYAEVLVTNNQPRLFSAIWGAGTMSVNARSVARAVKASGAPGILLLDPAMKASMNTTGSGGVTVQNASIIIDSSNFQAGYISNSGNVTAPNINFTGNYAYSNTGRFVGTLNTGVSPTPDPLASLPEPSTTGMTVQSSSSLHISSSGTYTLWPGLYTGGIAIAAPGPGSVTLMPGIYYMQGGGFSISGSINVAGTGVMIYNAPVQTSDKITLTGNGSLTLTPPTSGPYQGMTLFQDRTSTAVVTVTGNGSMNITGATYAAKAEMDITGQGGSNNVASLIVVNNMKVTGNGGISVVYSPNSVPPIRNIRLVE